MSFKAGEVMPVTFTISAPSGAAANADSLPTGQVYRNGALDATPTVVITNVATGVYKATTTVPVGYAAGDVVEYLIAAIVGGVATKGVIGRERLVAYTPTAADLGFWKTVTITDPVSSAVLNTPEQILAGLRAAIQGHMRSVSGTVHLVGLDNVTTIGVPWLVTITVPDDFGYS